MAVVDDEPGGQIQVEDLHPENARGTIVFVHGWPVSGRMFEYQTNWLPTQGPRTVAVGLRGHGRSSKPRGPYGCDTWADDLRAALDGMGLRDVTLAGFSKGGAISMRHTVYALTADGRLEPFQHPTRRANGHAFDTAGALVAAEHASGAVTRRVADGTVETLASTYDGKRLNSPSGVVVLRSDGTIYSTDPPFGLKPPYGPVERPSELGLNGVRTGSTRPRTR
jgi:pimeloyl-ACP methyl ester carboxylesterase